MFNFIYKVHVYLLKYEKKLFIKQKMQEKYGNQALWNKIMPPNLGIKTHTRRWDILNLNSNDPNILS